MHRRHHGQREGPRSTTSRQTVGIVTALNPVIGYEKATELAAEAYRTGKGLLEIIREKKILTEEQIKELLDPVKLTGLDPTKLPGKKQARVRSNVKSEHHAIMEHLTFKEVTTRSPVRVRSTARPDAGASALAQAPAAKPHVVILATGGTIAGAAAPETAAGYKSGRGRGRHR